MFGMNVQVDRTRFLWKPLNKWQRGVMTALSMLMIATVTFAAFASFNPILIGGSAAPAVTADWFSNSCSAFSAGPGSVVASIDTAADPNTISYDFANVEPDSVVQCTPRLEFTESQLVCDLDVTGLAAGVTLTSPQDGATLTGPTSSPHALYQLDFSFASVTADEDLTSSIGINCDVP